MATDTLVGSNSIGTVGIAMTRRFLAFVYVWKKKKEHFRSCFGTGREKMKQKKCLSIIKQIHTFTIIMLFEQRFSLGCPSLYQVKSTGARETKTSFKQHDAGERVPLLDDYDVTARTITETSFDFRQEGRKTKRKRGETVRDDNNNVTSACQWMSSEECNVLGNGKV